MYSSHSAEYIFVRKKLSTFSNSREWKTASNYVAKAYLEEVARKTYFDDVKIQMDAKVWAEEYNRQNPPKKARKMLSNISCF